MPNIIKRRDYKRDDHHSHHDKKKLTNKKAWKSTNTVIHFESFIWRSDNAHSVCIDGKRNKRPKN